MSAEVCQVFVDGLHVVGCISSSGSNGGGGCGGIDGGKSLRLQQQQQRTGIDAATPGGCVQEEARCIGDTSAASFSDLECSGDADGVATSGQRHPGTTSSAARGRPAHVPPAAPDEEEWQHLASSSSVDFDAATSPAAPAAAAAATARAAANTERCLLPRPVFGYSSGSTAIDFSVTSAAPAASRCCQREDAADAVVAAVEHGMCSITEEPGGFDEGFAEDQADPEEIQPGQDGQPASGCGTSRRKSSLNDLDKLKRLTARLGLNTRRPSYTAWLQGIGVGSHASLQLIAAAPEVTFGGSSSSTASGRSSAAAADRSQRSSLGSGHSDLSETAAAGAEDDVRAMIARVEQSLKDLRSELVKMQEMDQTLAKQFISLRHDVQQLRLQHTQLHYEDLLDEAAARSLTGSSRSDELLANDDMPLLRGRHDSSDSSGIAGCDLDTVDALAQLTSIGITKMNLLERRFSVF